MKFRIVTSKQPETFDIEVDSGHGGFKKAHVGVTSELEARSMVAQLQEEYRGKALWQPGVIIQEFDSE